jgi:hypothetical protein
MSRVDAAGLDAPGLDAAEDDAFTPGLDAPGLDAPGLDTPGLDAFAEGCAHPPAAFDEGLSPTCTLHVAVGGTGDGSEAAPFGDLEVAVRAATPGTDIRVHAGTHPGGHYVENVHGTATAPNWIRGEEGAVIDAAGAGEVLHVTEASYLVIEGLELRGSSANGLNIDDGGTPETPTHHVVMRDLWVHDVGTGGNNDCIKLSGIDDSMVLGSRIGDCRAGDANDHVGCHRMVSHGNTFEATPGGGVQMKGGSSDNVLHGNRFLEVAGRAINAGGSTGLEFFRPIDAPFDAHPRGREPLRARRGRLGRGDRLRGLRRLHLRAQHRDRAAAVGGAHPPGVDRRALRTLAQRGLREQRRRLPRRGSAHVLQRRRWHRARDVQRLEQPLVRARRPGLHGPRRERWPPRRDRLDLRHGPRPKQNRRDTGSSASR